MKSVIALAIFAVATVHADTVISLDPVGPVITTVGSGVTLDVDLYSSDPTVAGFNFSVAFNPVLLQVTNVTEQGFFANAGCCFGFSVDNPDGEVSGISDLVFGSAPDSITSATVPDTLVSIQFQGIAPGVAAVQLTCAQGDQLPCDTYPMLWDSNFNGIAASINQVNLTITADPGTAVPEPDTLFPLVLAVSILLILLVRRRECRA